MERRARTAATPRIIVIGAGIGGLSAAIYCAAAGARVRVYEQGERPGGKMNVWEQGGFRFDTGPHVLTMLFALDGVFRAAGTTLAAEMELVRLATICRYHFPGGEVIDAPGDAEDARRMVRRVAPDDAAGFDRFLAYAERVYDATTPTFLEQDFADHVDPARLPGQMRDFWSLRPLETLRARVERDFTDARLRQIFNLYALYSGSDPARCSALLAVIAHVQWRLGTYYPMGGLAVVAERLTAAARRMGVEIVASAPVRQVLTDGRRARGVAVCVNGVEERLHADAVISNRDALAAASLLPSPLRAAAAAARRAASSYEPTPSAFLMLLGVDGDCGALAHHNSLLTADEPGETASLWSADGAPHPDPTVGVACQSVTDPGKAPPGCANLFVMTNVAAGHAARWTPEAVAAYRERVLSKLEAAGLPGIRRRIRVEQLWTPATFQSRYAAWRGALYGPSGNGLRQMFTRPPMTDPRLPGLFYCGGSVHPGGGVPLCALSGKIVAEKVERYLGG